ncbi:3-phosphoserine/phosphohydroxythreonine transaminase [Eubacteriales bacterium OttesenSCG-928-M02]|nr:3-phosphoserine/phosphohydroxythreonine transaminase [Eubacteriales bacterium OttesenSCG-928-M02]
MAERVFNFAAGPAAMPLPVLEQAQKELVNKGGSGMSVMEMSHRSPEYETIIQSAESGLRALLAVPENYKVLFLQGGATLQFSTVPLNLMRNSFSADYLDTGSFANKALAEAKKFGAVRTVASGKAENYSVLPKLNPADLDEKADYLYMVTNNTIYGTKWDMQNLPIPPAGVPLVADASSNILSEEIDITKFGLIYFGAQKNVGPSGLTVVVVRDDLIGHAKADIPIYLDYKTQADNDSMYNTPPTFAIYMADLVFQWLKEQGGVAGIQQVNEEKAKRLYECIDNSSMYTGTVKHAADRSIMNITFVCPTEELNAAFVKEATAKGLTNLKGHRSAGGIRASIYNAVGLDAVDALIGFMKQFELDHK